MGGDGDDHDGDSRDDHGGSHYDHGGSHYDDPGGATRDGTDPGSMSDGARSAAGDATTPEPWSRAAVAFVAVAIVGFCAAHGAMAAATDWHVPLNDFWAIRFFAERLDLGDRSTFGQGFYPVGTFLWAAWPTDPTRTLVLANLAASAVLIVALALAARRSAGNVAAVVAVSALVIDTRWAEYVGCQTSDIAAASLFGLGVVALVSSTWRSGRAWSPFVAGALLGLAAVTRYHFAVTSLLLLGSWAVVSGRRLDAARALAAFAPLPIVQHLINRAAGVSTAGTQRFNIFKTVNDVNWYHVDAAAVPSSIVEILTADPARTLRQVAWQIGDVAPWAAVAAVAALVVHGTRHRRVCEALALFAVAYAALIAIGSSDRSPLALAPVAALTAGLAAQHLLAARGRATVAVVVAAAVVLLALPSAATSWRDHVARRAAAAEVAELSRTLQQEFGVRSATEVYTHDGDLYLPGMMPQRPHVQGGWQRFDLYGYDSVYPSMCHTDPECFVASLRAANVRVALLGPAARAVSPALGDLFSGRARVDGFQPVGQLGANLLFTVGSTGSAEQR